MKRKLPTIFLVLVICFLCLPGAAFAADAPKVAEPEFLDASEFVEPEYDDARIFLEGFAAVKSDNKWGFITKKGEEVIAPEYENADFFCEGLAAVKTDNKWGFIDKTGEKVVSSKYDKVSFFSEGIAAVCIENKWGYIDKTGDEIIEFKYDYAGDVNEDLAAVKSGDKWGFIDKSGEEVIAFKYDDVSDFSEGLAAVALDGKYGFINTLGEEIISPKYDKAEDFFEGFAPVCLAGKWGFIDKKGNEAVALKYDNAWIFSEDLAPVCLNGKWGFIDKTGKEVIPFKYDSDDGMFGFSEGLAAVKLDGKFGFIDKTGKEVVSLKYEDAWLFNDGIVPVKTGDKWGFITNDALVERPAPAKPAIARQSSQKVIVNGKAIDFDAYDINGFNYFKLRDIAFALTGTEKQFDVGWDEAKNAISLASNKAYIVTGGELGKKDPRNKKVGKTYSKIFIDGTLTPFDGYKILNNNYFKLRDIGTAFNFSVEYDAKTDSIIIDTKEGYGKSGVGPEPEPETESESESAEPERGFELKHEYEMNSKPESDTKVASGFSESISSLNRGKVYKKIFKENQMEQIYETTYITPTTLTFNAVGDIGFGTQYGKANNFRNRFNEKGPGYFVEDCSRYFHKADFNMANLENVFTDSTSCQKGKIYTYKAYSKNYVQVLKKANIGYVNVINNHMQDYLRKGFDDTIQLLKANSIVPFGTNLMPAKSVELGSIMTDSYAIFEKDDIKVGILGFFAFYGSYPTDAIIKERVNKLKDEGCDFIVANIHGGGQNTYVVDSQQVRIAHKLTDAGADLIIGHHPHILQKVEMYKGKKIYYSLGNFLFIDYGSSKNCETIIVNVTLTKTGDKIDVKYKNIPYLFTGVYGGNTYRPTQVYDKNAIAKIEKILGEKCN